MTYFCHHCAEEVPEKDVWVGYLSDSIGTPVIDALFIGTDDPVTMDEPSCLFFCSQLCAEEHDKGKDHFHMLLRGM